MAQRDEGFCADLKAIGAEARTSFAKLRGEPLGPPVRDATGWSETKYAVSRRLTGAQSCYVSENRHADGGSWTAYYCDFAPGPKKVDTVSRIAKDIISCTGIYPSQGDIDASDVDRDEDYAMVFLPGPGFSAKVFSLKSPASIRVSISNK